MKSKKIIKSGLQVLIRHKLRSFFMMLGIIIGTSSLILIVAIGAGSRQKMMDNIEKQFSASDILVGAGGGMSGGFSGGMPTTLVIEDLEDIKEEVVNVDDFDPVQALMGQDVKYGSKSCNAQIEGHSPIGLYINHRSFSSMANFIGCRPLNEAALALLGFNPLDAGKAISEHKLADKMVIVKADGDKLMSGQFGLTHYLQSIKFTHVPEFFEEKATSKVDGRILEGCLDHGDDWNMTFLNEKLAEWARMSVITPSP